MNPLKAIKAIFTPLTKAERRQAGIVLPEDHQKENKLPDWVGKEHIMSKDKRS